MRRAAVWFWVVAACLAAGALRAAPLEREQREATIRFVKGLQNEDGGFRPAPPTGDSQLGATNSALRALKYFGNGEPLPAADRQAVARFVRRCYAPEQRGFAEKPGGQPDVRSTAMGLMCMVELQAPVGERAEALKRFFQEKASALPEIYIAAAALHAAGLQPKDAAPWIAAYTATSNPDGTYGKSLRDTASAVVTLLRVNAPLPDRAATVAALKAAQRPDGGFSATGSGSDLATTYPVMRAFYMLKEKPDLARVRDLVARCRNADGGYGPTPGQPSTGPTTYYAGIILHWVEEMQR